MRYGNWDVLLFTGNSRVPIQEFDTKCHVLPNSNTRFVHHMSSRENPYVKKTKPANLCPVLTSFIPSLEHGKPFRVSIHSWEPPKRSHMLQSLKKEKEVVAYEARVCIDGEMVAQRVYTNPTLWPNIIDTEGSMKQDMSVCSRLKYDIGIDNDVQKPLSFPTFHPEILDQTHWDAGETHGRIRITLSEGIVQENLAGDNLSSSSFGHLKDIVIFAFQHAPKKLLEFSGIAWPNARLFRQAMRSMQSNMLDQVEQVMDSESHAHSPAKEQFDIPQRNFDQEPVAIDLWGNTTRSPGLADDPFVGPMPISLREKRTQARCSSNNTTDAPLQRIPPVRVTRSTTVTDMSGISYERVDFERTIKRAAVQEIVDALSPEKRHDLLKALSPQDDGAKAGPYVWVCNPLETTSMEATSASKLSDYRSVNTIAADKGTSGKNDCTTPLQGNLFASRFATEAAFESASRSGCSKTMSSPFTVKSVRPYGEHES